MQVIYGVTDIPITSVIMNTVELMAHYAEMDFLGGARHGYPQVEIALIPAPPATTVEVRLVIWALYGAVIDMTFNNGFKESEIPFSWDADIVGYLYFTIPEDSHPDSNNETKSAQAAGLVNITDVANSSTYTSTFKALGIGQFDWTPVYKPDGETIPLQDVFILTMGLLKAVAAYAAADRIRWPFHIGSDMVNTHAEIHLQGSGTPRSRPPYFQYGHIIEVTRRVPEWMLEQRKFAELWASIKSNSQLIGLLSYLKGPYQPNSYTRMAKI